MSGESEYIINGMPYYEWVLYEAEQCSDDNAATDRTGRKHATPDPQTRSDADE